MPAFRLIHLLLISSLGFARASESEPPPPWPWRPSEYVTQLDDHRLCHFSPSAGLFNVCDPDQLLREEEVQRLSAFLSRVANESHCSSAEEEEALCRDGCGGVRMGVALAKQTLQEHRPEEFARDIRRKWSLSDRCDNDLILFVSAEVQEVSISLGKTTERVFGQTSQSPLSAFLSSLSLQNTTIFEFLLNSTQYLAQTYQTRLKQQVLLSKHKTTTTGGATHPITWNAVVTLGYCAVILLILSTAFYFCCLKGKDGNGSEVTTDAKEEVESQLSTKYSDLQSKANHISELTDEEKT